VKAQEQRRKKRVQEHKRLKAAFKKAKTSAEQIEIIAEKLGLK